MSEVNQTPEEKNALLEEQAEREFAEIASRPDNGGLKALMKEEEARMFEYIHEHLEHFLQIDDCHAQAVLTWRGKFIICTYYRDMEDLMDDTWKLMVEDLTIVGVENASEITMVGPQVMSLEEGFFDEDED